VGGVAGLRPRALRRAAPRAAHAAAGRAAQAGVDRMLAPPAPGAPKEALQLHLRLLAEAHKRARTLVDQLQARRPARAAAG
jgi:hypothetical protein